MKKRKEILILLIVVILLVTIGISIFILSRNKKDINRNEDNNANEDNSLIGTYVYGDNNTEYEFKEDGTGNMRFGDYVYEYTYTAEDGILQLDFIKEEVVDAKYKYILENEDLQLISIEGTVSVGEEYQLKKKNK